MAKVLQMLKRFGFVESLDDHTIGPDDLSPEDSPSIPETSAETPLANDSEDSNGPEHRSIPAVSFDDQLVETSDVRPEDFPLAKIYASAGIEAPAHGFTVDKLAEMMNASEFASLDPATKATVIAGLLRRLPTGSVEVDDIVNDAARKDRALDAFERFLKDRVQSTADEIEEDNAKLQKEIDELSESNTALMENNRQRLGQEQARFDSWQSRKQTEEQRLFEAVEPFVQSNPVSRDDSDDNHA